MQTSKKDSRQVRFLRPRLFHQRRGPLLTNRRHSNRQAKKSWRRECTLNDQNASGNAPYPTGDTGSNVVAASPPNSEVKLRVRETFHQRRGPLIMKMD